MSDCDNPNLCIPYGDNFTPCGACPYNNDIKIITSSEILKRIRQRQFIIVSNMDYAAEKGFAIEAKCLEMVRDELDLLVEDIHKLNSGFQFLENNAI